MPKKTLKNISEIRRFFHRNETPIYFVSATNFNQNKAFSIVVQT